MKNRPNVAHYQNSFVSVFKGDFLLFIRHFQLKLAQIIRILIILISSSNCAAAGEVGEVRYAGLLETVCL